jgi:ferredoxin/flavodoxin---NADP+ reductase
MRVTVVDSHPELGGQIAALYPEKRVRTALLITAGIGTFEPRPLPAGSEYEGRGLRYFVPRLADLAGQDMVVVGGGDSAVDWALALRRRCIRRRRGGPLR